MAKTKCDLLYFGLFLLTKTNSDSTFTSQIGESTLVPILRGFVLRKKKWLQSIRQHLSRSQVFQSTSFVLQFRGLRPKFSSDEVSFRTLRESLPEGSSQRCRSATDSVQKRSDEKGLNTAFYTSLGQKGRVYFTTFAETSGKVRLSG